MRNKKVEASLVARPVRGKPLTSTDARRGRGPAKGAPNAGRPSGSFLDFTRKLREDHPPFRNAIIRAASNEESRAFGHVLRLVKDYDPEAPERRVAVSGGTSNELTVIVRYANPSLPPQVDSVGSLRWGEDVRR